MWKNSEIESGVGSEPATSKGAACWLSRPTQMVLASQQWLGQRALWARIYL